MKLALLVVPLAMLFQAGAVSACDRINCNTPDEEPATLLTPSVDDQQMRTRGVATSVSAAQRQKLSELILAGKLAEAFRAMQPPLAAARANSSKVACESDHCNSEEQHETKVACDSFNCNSDEPPQTVACDSEHCLSPEESSHVAAKGSSIQVAVAEEARVTYRGSPAGGASLEERQAVARLVRDGKLSEAYARLMALLPQH